MISFEENINVIYADNAATTKMSEKAVETMISLILALTVALPSPGLPPIKVGLTVSSTAQVKI